MSQIYVSTPPVPMSSLAMYVDSRNPRCMISAPAGIASIRDLANQDSGLATSVNVHYQSGTGDIYFDGSDELIMPSVSNYNNIFSSGGTVCGFFKANTTGPSNNARLIGKSSDGSEFGNGWWVNLANSSGGTAVLKFMRATTSGNGYGLWTTSNVITLGAWHFFAVQYNDSSISTAPSVYIDGAPTVVTASQSPTGTTGTDDTTSSVQIGNALSLTRGFDGYPDVIMLYKRTLTREELTRLFMGMGDRYAIQRSF